MKFIKYLFLALPWLVVLSFIVFMPWTIEHVTTAGIKTAALLCAFETLFYENKLHQYCKRRAALKTKSKGE
jgi:hypothetical protein